MANSGTNKICLPMPASANRNRLTHPLLIGLLVCAAAAIALSCRPAPNATPLVTFPSTLTPQLALTATPLPTATDTFAPVCTPPLCGTNEAYYCPDLCPGGCGTTCATHTPSPSPTASLIPMATPTPVRFAVIGDFGLAGEAEAEVAALVKDWAPDFILTTGDNNYPLGAADTIDENIGQYYHEFIYPYTGSYGEGAEINRFFPTLGNHDWYNLQAHSDYFTLPGNERYYDFVWGPVHFFALDSDSREPDGVNVSSVQAAWLKERLAASTTPWQIVYFHHAPYSSATHGNTDWMQWPFQQWGADAVLAGHDHVYERIVREGLPYFTIGSSGNPSLYWFTSQVEGSQVRYRDDHGALLVTASEQEITVVFQNRSSEIIDAYQLQAAARPVSAQSFPNPNDYQWQVVASGLMQPLGLTHASDGSGRLFIVEQGGLIRILQNGQMLALPFLDLSDRITTQNNEQGLLGLAFHPDFEQNGLFFVNYTDRDGNTVVSRLRVSAEDANFADPNTETPILRVRQPYANHNGGHLVFGPDGYLYIGLGDGGSGGDPEGNAQNLATLLGKLLRIDVDRGEPYAIPADNPFAAGGGLPEIWAWGLRNPWRFNFDRASGDLYIGDVGQNQWEEIDFLAAADPGGANLGWDFWEGSHPYEGSPPEGLVMVAPIWEYDHSQGCSVTSGVIYRGQMAEWQGIYLYGDFCSGKVWGLLRDAAGRWQNTLLFESGANITSFGEDESGEVYLVDRRGVVYLLTQK
jgi:glucose/arabinose dehydrogenase